MQPLNRRQARFVAEYMVDCKAQAAAIRAGYSSKDTAAGSKLLNRENVWAAVVAAQAAQFKRCQMSADEVLARLASNARAQVADVLNDDGSLKPVKDWSEDARRAVIGLEVEEHPVETRQLSDGDVDTRVVRVAKIKLADKNTALIALGKATGAIKEKVAVTIEKSHAELVLAAARLAKGETP